MPLGRARIFQLYEPVPNVFERLQTAENSMAIKANILKNQPRASMRLSYLATVLIFIKLNMNVIRLDKNFIRFCTSPNPCV